MVNYLFLERNIYSFKKRKLTLNENVLDQFTVELIKLKHSLIESRKNVDK